MRAGAAIHPGAKRATRDACTQCEQPPGLRVAEGHAEPPADAQCRRHSHDARHGGHEKAEKSNEKGEKKGTDRPYANRRDPDEDPGLHGRADPVTGRHQDRKAHHGRAFHRVIHARPQTR